MQIVEHLPPITRLISTHPITSVVAPTGSGKSIGVPSFVAQAGARCFVSVPTVTGAVSLYSFQRVIQESRKTGKLSVGYAAEGDVQYTDQDQIVYVTSGHLRRKMLSYFREGRASPITFCQVLILDEVHTGSLDNTVVLSLWLRAAAVGQVPRLVLMSATPIPIPFLRPTPVVYEVPEAGAFPVEIQYLAQDVTANTSNRGQVDNLLYHETAALVARVHNTTPIENGSMLIFAPGASEVQQLEDLLRNTHKITKAMIVGAYGSMKREEIDRLYQEPPSGIRKIIVATNIAESTITINGLGFVFDTLLEKRAETSLTGGTRLVLTTISQDSAKQRAGRTGRTRPGVCYRMCTAATFETLEPHRLPEIERIPLYSVVMELLDVGLSPLGTLREINEGRLKNSLDLLRTLGMITGTAGAVTVTEKGHFSANFPLGVKNAALLWEWREAGHPLFPGVVIISLIDCYGPPYYWFPRRTPEQSEEEYRAAREQHYVQYFQRFQGLSDVESLLKMWSFFMEEIKGYSQVSPQTLNKWAYQNSINAKKLREALQIIRQCTKILERLNPRVPVTPGKFTPEGVLRALRPLVARVYREDILLRVPQSTTYRHPKTGFSFKLDTRGAVNSFDTLVQGEVFKPPAIAPLLSAEISGNHGTVNIVSLALDVDPPSSQTTPPFPIPPPVGILCPPPPPSRAPTLGYQPQILPKPQPHNVGAPRFLTLPAPSSQPTLPVVPLTSLRSSQQSTPPPPVQDVLSLLESLDI